MTINDCFYYVLSGYSYCNIVTKNYNQHSSYSELSKIALKGMAVQRSDFPASLTTFSNANSSEMRLNTDFHDFAQGVSLRIEEIPV